MHTGRPPTLSAVIVLSSLLASGCLSSDTLIKVRADGSGTVEQTLMVNPKTFDQFAAMAGQMAGGEAKDAPSQFPSAKDMLDETKLREAAARFGKGVRYVSSAPVKSGHLEGAKAIFAFDDINALNVSQSPDGGSAAARDPMTFRLDRRPTGSVLTITMKEPPPEAGALVGAGAEDEHARPPMPPEALAFIKPLLQGLRVAVAVDVEGGLIRTNADHVSGNRVTLLDIDFDPLLENPGAFEKLTSLGPGANIAQVKPLLKDLPGIKMNTNSTVTIEFR